MDLHPQSSGGSLSEMNLTPLVDVMMVLMIIFMVTSSMDPAGIDLDLPDTSEAMIKKELDTLTVYMELSGKITVTMGPKVTYTADIDSLESVLKTRFPGVKEANIKGDKKLAYQKIMELLVKARLAGITKLGLLMDHVKKEKPGVK